MSHCSVEKAVDVAAAAAASQPRRNGFRAVLLFPSEHTMISRLIGRSVRATALVTFTAAPAVAQNKPTIDQFLSGIPIGARLGEESGSHRLAHLRAWTKKRLHRGGRPIS